MRWAMHTAVFCKAKVNFFFFILFYYFSLITDDAFEVPIVQRPREEEIQAITLLKVRDNKFQDFLITINVFVVYMARDVMILLGENPFRELLEGVGPEN
jgi:hypothetical protein